MTVTTEEQLNLDGMDLRVALMCLVHATGDQRWLEPPFTPRRDVRLIPDPTAGLDDEAQLEVVRAVRTLLEAGEVRPVINDPGDELMVRMMGVCLGEEVAEEYAPMMREQMGFTRQRFSTLEPSVGQASGLHHVVIVGAGIGGIALAARLRTMGVSFTVLERNDHVGGTWWEHRYPGCGVDTPNLAYSFSYGPRYRWTHYFSLRDEIHDYLERCTTEFGIRDHIRFGLRVTGTRWDEEQSRWLIDCETADGRREQVVASVLVPSIGLLAQPYVADFEGLESFAGEVIHPSRWPERIDLAGKRVAVIGTGATAMQLVPSIAPEVASLTVYQRTAQWVRDVGAYRDEIPEVDQDLFERLPYYSNWFRFAMFWRYGDGLLATLYKDPEWPHPDRSVNRRNDRHRQEMVDFIERELATRPELVDKCIPDYPPYGKRILIDNGWYRTLCRENVELVVEPIRRIDRDGIVSADGQHRPVDVLIIATGFRVVEMASRLGIVGKEGVSLSQAWADENPTAYLGITVPGFPNMFMFAGPNSGLGHGGSGIFQAECQANYISGLIGALVQHDLSTLEVTQEAHDEFVTAVDTEHEKLVWTHPGMRNWFHNKHGRVIAAMPWRLVDFWQMTRRPDLTKFVCTPRSG